MSDDSNGDGAVFERPGTSDLQALSSLCDYVNKEATRLGLPLAGLFASLAGREVSNSIRDCSDDHL